MDEINLGNELFLEKKFQEAIKKYDSILEKEPNNLTALNNKGYSLSKLKKYSEALSCYDKFLQHNFQETPLMSTRLVNPAHGANYQISSKITELI